MNDESLSATVASLSPDDLTKLIGSVWDTLSPDDLPVSDAERALLDARLADMEAHPDDQSPWPEVKARLERLTRLVTKFKSVAAMPPDVRKASGLPQRELYDSSHWRG